VKLRFKASAAFDRLIDVLSVAVMLILIIQMLGISAHVVMRYVLRSPWEGTLTWGQISLVWTLFLGAAWVLREEKHIKLEMLVGTINPRKRAFIDSITSILAAIAMLVVVWFSTGVTYRSFRESTHMLEYYDVLQAPVYTVIPFGSLLLSIQFLRRAYHNWMIWKGNLGA
jgi:TRAP-type C4-dicarboxylate transport system permease small subunit